MKLIKAMLTVLTVTILSSACTKVEVPVENELTPDNFPKNEAQFLLASGSAYAKFREQFATTYWQLQSLSSDEAILPTRGSNWFDGGRYQQLHYHTWTPDNPQIAGVWSWGFSTISSCNQILSLFEQAPDSESKLNIAAEIKTLRALSFYLMMDLYGNIPLTTKFGDPNLPQTQSRKDVFAFIEKEVKEVGVCLIKFKALRAAADGRAVILTINSDNSLSHPCAEKTSRCASFRKRGSLTVEAALVFPLFLFALTAFLSLFFLVQVRVEIGRALTDTGRELAQMAYFSEDAGSLAPSAMAMLYGQREVEAYLEDRVAAEIIKDGADGISFLGTVWNEEDSVLTLRASFQAVLPPWILWFRPVQISVERSVRGFTGFAGRSGIPETEDSEIVYVTDHGTVYHRDLGCRHLKLSVQQTELDKVEELRNGDGAKYYPCERCWKEGSEIVFLTEEGNRYHQTLNCSSLVRGIHAVHLWETGGLPPCSVCGG